MAARWSLMNQIEVVVKRNAVSRYWRVWLVPVDAPAARVCIGAAWTEGKARQRAVVALSMAQTALDRPAPPPKIGPLQQLMEQGVR